MGIITIWSADRPGGFTNEELEALQNIQRRFAVACKTAIQSRIARNISETYLGKEAGGRVLAGSIRRGDGRETKAVVWYNDMRNSTALADTMPGTEFIQLLNLYFDCTATPSHRSRRRGSGFHRRRRSCHLPLSGRGGAESRDRVGDKRAPQRHKGA